MDAREAAVATGGPLGGVGAGFYFSPQAVARAGECGFDVIGLYACGRGGVLGDATPEEVDRVFAFFKPGLIAGMVEAGRSQATGDIMAAHVASAVDYARATFGGIDPAVLAAFSAAARTVVASLPTGRWPLVDGYRALPVPEDPVAEAYWWAVLLREVRGGVHTEVVAESELSFAAACQFDRGDDYYRLHGFGDDDRVPETEEALAARAEIEEETEDRMAGLFGVLDDAGLAALVAGAVAFEGAVFDPVPVD
jgi:hypothetical protein